MDSLLNRYRSIVLLIVVLFGQLVWLAYQVKNDDDVRVLRVWTVSVIAPIAQVAEGVRSTAYGVFHNYFDLRHARDENRRMRSEMDKLKLENQFLHNELNAADRLKALSTFEREIPSRVLAARIIGTAATSTSKIVFLDRGSVAKVEKGMAIITPDGIVGKVLAAYPYASQALLATDPGFAAGVVSQKNHVRGILRGMGSGKCKVDNVQNEEKVEQGELFFTSGDDRIFPRGLVVGKADVVRDGGQFKDILLYPSGLQNGPEEVLIVLQGAHQNIPEMKQPLPDNAPMYLGPEPPQGAESEKRGPGPVTEADRLREKYKSIGEATGHKFGEGPVPNFNVVKPVPPPTAAPGTSVSTPRPTATTPSETAAPAARAPRTVTGDPAAPRPVIPRPVPRPGNPGPVTPRPATPPPDSAPATRPNSAPVDPNGSQQPVPLGQQRLTRPAPARQPQPQTATPPNPSGEQTPPPGI